MERRFVWRWTVANTGENDGGKISDATAIPGLLLPYSQDEEGSSLNSSDHMQQPKECYQYKLSQEWLDAVIVEDDDRKEPPFDWTPGVKGAPAEANALIKEHLKSGERLPQTNREFMLWHKLPEGTHDPKGLPGLKGLPEEADRKNKVRQLVYEVPKEEVLVRGVGILNRGRRDQNGQNLRPGEYGQNLKYLYPSYRYKENEREKSSYATAKDGQREKPREGDRPVPVMFVDVNAHAPLIFENQGGGLKPKYMQTSKRKVQYKKLGEGFRSDVVDSKVPTKSEFGLSSRELLQLMRDKKEGHAADFTAAELQNDTDFLDQLGTNLADLTKKISRFPNLVEAKGAAHERARKTSAYKAAADAAARWAIERPLVALALLNSNFNMPQNLCDIVSNAGVNTILDTGTHAAYKDEEGMLEWGLVRPEDLEEIVYAPPAAASTDPVEQYPYPPRVEPETKAVEMEALDNVKAVFFPTLPSATQCEAELSFYPMLDCSRVYGYELDGMNRDKDADLNECIPSVWKMAMLHREGSLGKPPDPISTGISDKMFTNDFTARVQQYKADKEAYDRDIDKWLQIQKDFKPQADERETQLARWHDYSLWYNTLTNAKDTTSIQTNGHPVKRIPLRWSDDKGTRSFSHGVGFPSNSTTGLKFAPKDYVDAGFVGHDIDSTAESWVLRPARNTSERQLLVEIGEDPNTLEDWDFFVKNDLIMPEDLKARWASFAEGVVDYGHVYAFPPQPKPTTIQVELRPEPPQIPTLPTQYFDTGVDGGTTRPYNQLNSTIFDDPTFMHVVQHLTKPRLTAADPGIFEHPHVQKTQKPDATPPSHASVHNKAYIIPYALYDKAEFDRMMAENPVYQAQSKALAEREAIEEAYRAKKAEAAAAKALADQEKANEDEAARQSLEEARQKLEAMVNQVIGAVMPWKEQNVKPVHHYLPVDIIETVNGIGADLVKSARDLSIQEWCDAWIRCDTELNPFDYMLSSNRAYIYNGQLRGNVYTYNGTNRPIKQMDGLNRQDGVRFESETQYNTRLKTWEDASDALLKLPWRPERHEPSFNLLLELAGVDTGPLATQGIRFAGERPRESFGDFDARLRTWIQKLAAAKDIYTGREANKMYQANKNYQATANGPQTLRRKRAELDARRDEEVRDRINRGRSGGRSGVRSGVRSGGRSGGRSGPAGPVPYTPPEPGPYVLDLPPLQPAQPAQPPSPGPQDPLPMPGDGVPMDEGPASGDSARDSTRDSEGDSEGDDFLDTFQPKEDKSAGPGGGRGKAGRTENYDELPEDEMEEGEDVLSAFRKRRASTRASLLNTGEKLERLHLNMVGDVANRRTPEHTLDELIALVGQASDQSFVQMVLRCDITDRWMLYKMRESGESA